MTEKLNPNTKPQAEISDEELDSVTGGIEKNYYYMMVHVRETICNTCGKQLGTYFSLLGRGKTCYCCDRLDEINAYVQSQGEPPVVLGPPPQGRNDI